jgi:hypothetical protein
MRPGVSGTTLGNQPSYKSMLDPTVNGAVLLELQEQHACT